MPRASIRAENEGPIGRQRKDKVINPGTGLLIMGISYLIWWIMPIPLEYMDADPRWAHNWAYAIIIITAGASWFHKSASTRVIASIQAFMLPVTASGSVDSTIMTAITTGIALGWGVIFFIERGTKKELGAKHLSKRAKTWLALHAQVITWLLIAHMGFVFFLSRAPFENQLRSFGEDIAFLANLPPEFEELATWFFDIALIGWAIIALAEVVKMGYNIQDKPWPPYSFWASLAAMGAGLLGLGIQALIFGL